MAYGLQYFQPLWKAFSNPLQPSLEHSQADKGLSRCALNFLLLLLPFRLEGLPDMPSRTRASVFDPVRKGPETYGREDHWCQLMPSTLIQGADDALVPAKVNSRI